MAIDMMVIWLVVEPTPLKNDGVNVSWDDDIPNILWNIKNVPNHQPVITSSAIFNIAMEAMAHILR